jgi:hypothetical protein
MLFLSNWVDCCLVLSKGETCSLCAMAVSFSSMDSDCVAYYIGHRCDLRRCMLPSSCEMVAWVSPSHSGRASLTTSCVRGVPRIYLWQPIMLSYCLVNAPSVQDVCCMSWLSREAMARCNASAADLKSALTST